MISRFTWLVCWLATVSQAAATEQAMFVEFEGEPLASAYARGVRGAELRLRARSLDDRRRGTIESIRGMDPSSSILFTTRNLVFGVAIRGDAVRIGELGRVGGVKAVHPLTHAEAHTSRSVPFIQSPAFWQATGLTGRDVTIAVIDSGVDYLHAGLGGPGSGYERNDTTLAGDVPGFPGAKVVGGWDFCGDDYNSIDQANNIPRPDPDPMDCRGHGTHVAGIAAGSGVNPDGTTYTGPYDSTTPFDQLAIGPGVAPEARLYALRVFGCRGTTDLVLEAMDWAMDPNGDGDLSDHVDVINLSLGASYASEADPTQTAADMASQAGVIVVASAGNAGDSYYNVASPSSSVRAVSVASSIDDRLGADSIDAVSDFSARGPTSTGHRVKPDVAAPGARIVSIKSGSGTGSVELSGTSMAAPHVAGAAALLRGLHPGWSTEEIKALLMNSAGHDLYSGAAQSSPIFGPGRVGAGRIDPGMAIEGDLLAYATEPAGAVSLSFGLVEAPEDMTVDRMLTINNKASRMRIVDLAYSPRADAAGVEVVFPDGGVVEVPAEGLVEVPVRLVLTPDHMRHDREPSVPAMQGGRPRHWITEESGLIWVTPRDGVRSLRVPMGAVVRAVSTMRSAAAPLALDRPGGSLEVSLTGRGLQTGPNLPLSLLSVLFPFELAYSSPVDPRFEGVFASADLHHIGIRVEAGAEFADSMIRFGISTHGSWSSAIGDTAISINIDLDGDSKPDRLLFRTAYTTQAGFTDAYNSLVYDYRTGAFSPRTPVNIVTPDVVDTVANNTNVITLSVSARDLGLAADSSRFRYQVAVYHYDDLGMGELTPWLRYDASRPGLVFGEVYYNDLPGVEVAASYDRDAWLGNRSKGLLLFHQNNAAGAHDEVVPVLVPALRDRGDFDGSGCVDLADFLVIIDNWGLEYQGLTVGIDDFMALMDHWLTGPGC